MPDAKPSAKRPAADLAQVAPADREAWRAWLAEHHARSPGVWLVLPKKGTGRRGISYDDAVEEALCFGWIDSRTKTLDAECYVLLFTPRKPRSGWSATNKAR